MMQGKPARKQGVEAPPPARCAFTQWYQDLAPPLVVSTMSARHREAREEQSLATVVAEATAT